MTDPLKTDPTLANSTTMNNRSTKWNCQDTSSINAKVLDTTWFKRLMQIRIKYISFRVLMKLDSLSPMENRSYTDWLCDINIYIYYFIYKKIKKKIMWHMTHDKWHMTCRGWWTMYDYFSSIALIAWESWCFQDLEEKGSQTHLIDKSMNDESVCLTMERGGLETSGSGQRLIFCYSKKRD